MIFHKKNYCGLKKAICYDMGDYCEKCSHHKKIGLFSNMLKTFFLFIQF